uniref:Biogenesis of lysosome-related organelles complex 1 subunit 6 n=1 Tax=Ciona savignyi TaxID=51511 RepID=H2Y9B0_CIOSA
MGTAGVSSESEILSQHFFREFEPMLCETKAKLNDVKQNQTVLIESLEREKDKLKEISMINEIEEAMSTVHSYRMKLVKIKRSMGLLKEASTRIRKEACHLEQLKRKEKVKEQERNRQALEEENKLTAQLSKQFK